MVKELLEGKIEKMEGGLPSEYPLTTAPALILRDERILPQGLMTYAAPGADTDLSITTAVDIRVKKTDNEAGRKPNAAVWQGDQFGGAGSRGRGGGTTSTAWGGSPGRWSSNRTSR